MKSPNSCMTSSQSASTTKLLSTHAANKRLIILTLLWRTSHVTRIKAGQCSSYWISDWRFLKQLLTHRLQHRFASVLKPSMSLSLTFFSLKVALRMILSAENPNSIAGQCFSMSLVSNPVMSLHVTRDSTTSHSSHTTTANSMVDWTPARLLLALQQLYKKVKFSPKFPWLSSHFGIFPDFPDFPWPLKFSDLFQFSLTCRNPGLRGFSAAAPRKVPFTFSNDPYNSSALPCVCRLWSAVFYVWLISSTQVRGYNTQFLLYPRPLSWWN